MDAKLAYKRLYNWFDSKSSRISARDLDLSYRSQASALASVLPKPEQATPNDMMALAQEVLTGSLEWAYHEKDDQSIKLHEYARTIVTEFSDKYDPSKSSLAKGALKYRYGRKG